MPIRSPLLFPISSSLSFTAAGGGEPLLVFVCVSLYLYCVRLPACVSLLASYHQLSSCPLLSAPGYETYVKPGEKLGSLHR